LIAKAASAAAGQAHLALDAHRNPPATKRQSADQPDRRDRTATPDGGARLQWRYSHRVRPRTHRGAPAEVAASWGGPPFFCYKVAAFVFPLSSCCGPYKKTWAAPARWPRAQSAVIARGIRWARVLSDCRPACRAVSGVVAAAGRFWKQPPAAAGAAPGKCLEKGFGQRYQQPGSALVEGQGRWRHRHAAVAVGGGRAIVAGAASLICRAVGLPGAGWFVAGGAIGRVLGAGLVRISWAAHPFPGRPAPDAGRPGLRSLGRSGIRPSRGGHRIEEAADAGAERACGPPRRKQGKQHPPFSSPLKAGMSACGELIAEGGC